MMEEYLRGSIGVRYTNVYSISISWKAKNEKDYAMNTIVKLDLIKTILQVDFFELQNWNHTVSLSQVDFFEKQN